ncbi:MAG: head GIN domain-containing protein [Chitinophagaceae bacterium]
MKNKNNLQRSVLNSLSLLFMIAGAVLFFSSCRKVVGTGPVITENRSGDYFTSISLHLSGNVYYKQASVYSIEIKAQQNILDIIESPVINQELILRFKKNVFVRRHEDISITISSPSVSALNVNGSCNLQTIGDFSPANCRLEINGSGNISIFNLVTDNMDGVISGSGDIKVSGGSANHQSLKISGSGSMDYLNMSAKTVNTTTSGSGSIKVNVSERLDAKISGSGHVYYRGTPVVNVSISGSGKVTSL